MSEQPDVNPEPSDPTPARDSRAKRPGPGQGRGPRGQRLVRHFKVDHRLTPEDRLQYEALLLDPRSTIDSLLKWLHDKGYKDMSRGGVARHRRQFELDIKGIRHDARVAGQFAALARAQGGPTALADAGQFRFEQMFLENLFRMKKTDDRASREWVELGRAMTTLLENRQQLEQQRAEFERKAKGIIELIEKRGKPRIDGNALSDKVRRFLGMPLPGEPIPGLPGSDRNPGNPDGNRINSDEPSNN